MKAKEASEITKKSLLEKSERQRIESEKRIDSGMYRYFFELIKEEASKGREILRLHANTLTSVLKLSDSINSFSHDFKRMGYKIKVLAGETRIEISWEEELTNE
jgi:hypothetical protein